MRGWRAPALAGAAGIAAGLWLSGLAMSCSVRHAYDAWGFDCPEFFRPQCCDSCDGISITSPTCGVEGWVCPPPSVSSLSCPNPSHLCRFPLVTGDAGACSDSGSGAAQDLYSFPGCAPQTLACPNDGVLGCALRTIQSRHDGCRLTSECAVAPLDGGCTGWGSCPPFAVNATRQALFLSEAQVEVSEYCGCPQCSWSVECPGLAGTPRCVYGQCTWVSGQVSYACADRRLGQCYPACPEDEACFTQVACAGGPDGGCLPAPDGGALPLGDDVCHPRCAADAGCPAGQRCFQVPFFGCAASDGGPPPTSSICCAADAGCR